MPGYAVAGAGAEVGAGDQDITLDVSFRRFLDSADEEGRPNRLEGRVLDEGGEPIAGLPLVVWRWLWWPEMSISMEWMERLPDLGGGPIGTAVTDARGRFEIFGLQWTGIAGAISQSPEWFLLEDAENAHVMRGGATLRARRTTRLTLDVRDAGGQSLSEYVVHVQQPGEAPIRRARSEGADDFLWPDSTRGAGRPTDVAVQAPGYASARLRIEAGTGPRRERREVHLSPLALHDTVQLRVGISGLDWSWLPAPEVVLREPGQELPLYAFPLTRQDDGEFAARVPSGRWDGSIVLAGQPGQLKIPLRKRFPLDARGRDPEPVRWELPPLSHARFFVENRPDAAFGRTLTLSRAGEDSLRFPATDDPVQLPIGEWDVVMTDRDGAVVAYGHIVVPGNPGHVYLLHPR